MTVKLTVSDMACGVCEKAIAEAILEIDAKASIKADSQTKEVIVESSASESDLKKAISDAGYSPD